MELQSPKPRDQRLDIAKGIAIILVVIGHTIQTRFNNFDDVLGFRMIYSFHMPLFVFLSGTVASLWFKPKEIALRLPALIQLLAAKIRNAFVRLVIPFIAWALIGKALSHTGFNPIEAVIAAFRRPDSALWFLLCIFYCVVLLAIFQICLAALLHALNERSLLHRLLLNGQFQLIVMGLTWLLLKNYSPPGAGLSTLKTYFLFYILGIGFYKYLHPLVRTKWRLLGCILFILLSPHWSRVAPNNLLYNLPGNPLDPILAYCFAPLVALSGTLLIWEIVCQLSQRNFRLVNVTLAYLGKLSLGIYALHTFFLDLNPPVIASLALSVAISILLLQFKLSRLVLMGEK